MRSATHPISFVDAALAILAALFCFAFPFRIAPVFAKMFRDFHAELSDFTVLGLTHWFPIAVGVVPLVALALGRRVATTPRAIQRATVGIVLVSIAAPLTLLVAMYSTVLNQGMGDLGLDLPAGRTAGGRYLGGGLPR